MFWRWRCRRHRISFLVPLQVRPGDSRWRIWKWLRRYWKSHIHGVEIVIGHDDHRPFSKTRAVNDAARRARGDMFVIIDADCYLDSKVIKNCIRRIKAEEKRGHHVWMIPYRRFYRLNQEATDRILASSPRHPYREPVPPPPGDLEPDHVDTTKYGHHYAAMIMIMPRRAFERVGGMDPRFCGWGGEDISFMHALDTLWGPHKTSNTDVFHLYHDKIGQTWKTRKWEGQEAHMPFGYLASRYSRARNDPARMRRLVDEGFKS